jgi:hypothetical protein
VHSYVGVDELRLVGLDGIFLGFEAWRSILLPEESAECIVKVPK